MNRINPLSANIKLRAMHSVAKFSRSTIFTDFADGSSTAKIALRRTFGAPVYVFWSLHASVWDDHSSICLSSNILAQSAQIRSCQTPKELPERSPETCHRQLCLPHKHAIPFQQQLPTRTCRRGICKPSPPR